MKYLGKIQDNKDLVTKEYVDRAASDLEGRKISKPGTQIPANYAAVSDGHGGYTWSEQQLGYFTVVDGKICAVYEEEAI